MPTTISYTAYDVKPTKIVPVIASFDAEGHIKPLYVRIGELSLKVHSSWIKPASKNILEFNCELEDDDRLKPLILTYYRNEMVWAIRQNE